MSVFVLWFGYGDEDFDVFMVQLEQLQREEREKKKEEKKKLQDELNTLFKPVQTVSKGKASNSVTVEYKIPWDWVCRIIIYTFSYRPSFFLKEPHF